MRRKKEEEFPYSFFPLPFDFVCEAVMFRLYEWNFSSTIEIVTAVLLAVTILAVGFVR